MKKWFPAFLFLSLSGCNDALAGWHNVMFYAFNDYSGYDSGNMTIFDRGQFTIPVSYTHLTLPTSDLV